MQFSDPIKIAYRNLTANKFRSFLTILGIIIGVASVILIMAIGQSAQGLILNQLEGVGSNLVLVIPGGNDNGQSLVSQLTGINITSLKYRDFLAIMDKNNVPEVQAGAAYVQANEIVSYNGNESTYSINGVTHEVTDVESLDILEGRSFMPEEDTNMARVAIVGENLKKDLFNGDDPVGKQIKIDNQIFNVIGVFHERVPGVGGDATDDMIILPFRTTQKLLLGIDHVNVLRFKVSDASQIAAAKNDIAKTLRIQHNITDPANDDFSVNDMASALSAVTNVTDVIRYFLLAVASIALVVGGVGIMNIMLISVNQRIHEVGLRKAVGARNSDILEQFLLESATITLVGGIVGIIIGIAFAFLISVIITKGFGYSWQFIVSWQSIVVATLVSVIIGLIFGIYPARKASRISPMEALRYE